MKVTPLEIRKKTFEKVFRGYDKDEVNGFLLSLSQEWEKALDENKELKYKMEAAEKEIVKLREIEDSLFKTLKTAEDTGANMIEQANKTAELHLKETQMKADGLINESESKAKATIEEAENKSRHILESLQDEVKKLQDSHRKLQNQRETMLREMKSIASDFLEKVEQSKSESDQYSIDEVVEEAKDSTKVSYAFARAKQVKENNNKEPEGAKAEPPSTEGSFFDQI